MLHKKKFLKVLGNITEITENWEDVFIYKDIILKCTI